MNRIRSGSDGQGSRIPHHLMAALDGDGMGEGANLFPEQAGEPRRDV